MEPGMSDEVCVLATVEVDATLPENQHPVTELEDSEFIEVIMAPLDNLLEFILGACESFQIHPATCLR
jgi:ADP-ribose pyrophosphatase